MDIPQERRVVTEIPGPRSRALMARRVAAVPRGVFATTPVFVEAASGAIIRDVDGNDLIDLGAGLAVLNTGNTSPAVVQAVRDQLDRFTHTCMHVTMGEPYVELAERLNQLVPGDVPRKTKFAKDEKPAAPSAEETTSTEEAPAAAEEAKAEDTTAETEAPASDDADAKKD